MDAEALAESGLRPGAVVGITGASGLVGRAIQAELERRGFGVVRFSRSGGPGTRFFSLGEVPDFSGLEAVIHLAGENILGLWTAEKKRRIRESRIQGTRRVVEGIARAGSVRVLLSASAVGYYGVKDAQEKNESAAPGRGFLAEVCQGWEAEAVRARETGVRVGTLRIGLVLAPPQEGGAMRLLAPVFRAGLGGRLGSGRQWMSAIHLADLAEAAVFLLARPELSGAFNFVAPQPLTNLDFTRSLGQILHRPTPWIVPAPMLRLALGGLAELLLGESRVVPERLLEAGYAFRFGTVPSALRDLLGK